MSTVVITGNPDSILGADADDFNTAEENTGLYEDDRLGALTIFQPGGSFVFDTHTATSVTGFDFSAEGDLSLTGTNFLGTSGTITHAAFQGQIDGSTITLDGHLTWNTTGGIVGGTISKFDINLNTSEHTSGDGTLHLDADGNITGTLKHETVTTSTGNLVVELTGNFNIDHSGGSITKVYVHDADGTNGISYTGTFDAQDFFDHIDNFGTFTDVLNDPMFSGGNDTVTGTANADALFGFDGADTLNGLDGQDSLDGGAGADTMKGGKGEDAYFVDNTGDKIIENAGEGDHDSVVSSVSYTLSANVEQLILTGKSDIDGTGNASNNYIGGNDGDNTLDGAGGVDTLEGGFGNDTYVIGTLDDVVNDASGLSDTVVVDFNNTSRTVAVSIGAGDFSGIENVKVTGTGLFNVTGTADDNILIGNASVNTLTGHDGNDMLDGGGGADRMDGGDDDDTYVVDNAGDVIVDSDGVNDTVIDKMTSGTFTLAAGIENLILSGTGAINGTGNGDSNALTGNSGANILDGGVGGDSMTGGAGNDTYFVDDGGDNVTESLAGTAGGTDTVKSTISFELGDNLENLILLGKGDVSGSGNELANSITGNSGNNLLDGEGGADKLAGGAGSDTYYVDLVASGTTAKLEDTVTEGTNAGNDTLVVRTSGDLELVKALTITLGSNFENMTLSLSGSNHLNITGNTADNSLIGNAGDNTIDGGKGADYMSGSDGNDTYIIDDQGDVVNDSGTGDDTVKSSVSIDLTGHTDIEHIILTGSAAIDAHASNIIGSDITGNTGANALTAGTMGSHLTGGGGADVLTDSLGDDILDGGAGHDTMSGIAGQDTFVFHGVDVANAANSDTIIGFTAGAAGDTISLSDVLTGYTGETESSNIADFIHLAEADGSTIVSIDRNGLAGGAHFVQVATLLGVTSLDVHQLLTDGNITVGVT